MDLTDFCLILPPCGCAVSRSDIRAICGDLLPETSGIWYGRSAYRHKPRKRALDHSEGLADKRQKAARGCRHRGLRRSRRARQDRRRNLSAISPCLKQLADGLRVPCIVQLHLLEVEKTCEDFPERGQRRSEWVSFIEAAKPRARTGTQGPSPDGRPKAEADESEEVAFATPAPIPQPAYIRPLIASRSGMRVAATPAMRRQ